MVKNCHALNDVALVFIQTFSGWGLGKDGSDIIPTKIRGSETLSYVVTVVNVNVTLQLNHVCKVIQYATETYQQSIQIIHQQTAKLPDIIKLREGSTGPHNHSS